MKKSVSVLLVLLLSAALLLPAFAAGGHTHAGPLEALRTEAGLTTPCCGVFRGAMQILGKSSAVKNIVTEYHSAQIVAYKILADNKRRDGYADLAMRERNNLYVRS